ncbi:hypothetical protein JVW19_23725, partial [Vibrio cholerae O1]|nr:hypothetical protein [Vibrio cholerae O1]
EAAKSEGEAGKVYSQSQSGSLTIKQGEKVTITINYYGDYVKPEKPKHNAGELVEMTGAQAKAWASKNKINVSGIT